MEEIFKWQSFLIQILTNGSDIQTGDAVVCSAIDTSSIRCCEMLYSFPFDFESVPLMLAYLESESSWSFMTEELWENKQWLEVVLLNDHQSKIKAAVVCDLPGVAVPLVA